MPTDDMDLKVFNLLMRAHPELRESFEIVRTITTKAQFPINSFSEFSEAMGGDDATISVAGQVMRMKDVASMVPAYYFPIANENDLIAKVSDLTNRRGTPVPLTPPGVTLMPATAKKSPDAGEPPRHLERLHLAVNTPGIAGYQG